MGVWCRFPGSPVALLPPIATAVATWVGTCLVARSAFKPPLGKPALLRQIDELPALGPKTATSNKEIRGRLEMLLGVDDSLRADPLRRWSATGTLNDTMIVFTSDHGYFYGEHGLNEERRLAYEETIRIPLVIRYPPLAMAGSTPPEMALSLDIAPTLLEVGRNPAGR